MAQTPEGAIRCAAKKIGVTAEEYKARALEGQKWCHRCRAWNPRDDYRRDVSRWDGLSAVCAPCLTWTPSVKTGTTLSPKDRRSLGARKGHEGRSPDYVSPMKGKTHGEAARQKMREAARARAGQPNPRKGQSRSLEVRRKISIAMRARALRGSACPAYKDGRNSERRGLRESPEYKRWRYDVYLRDGFACQLCGDGRGGNLNAHHIFAFAICPELRLNVDNGVTLCEGCHDRLHYKPDSVRNKQRLRGLIPTVKLIRRKGGG